MEWDDLEEEYRWAGEMMRKERHTEKSRDETRGDGGQAEAKEERGIRKEGRGRNKRAGKGDKRVRGRLR